MMIVFILWCTFLLAPVSSIGRYHRPSCYVPPHHGVITDAISIISTLFVLCTIIASVATAPAPPPPLRQRFCYNFGVPSSRTSYHHHHHQNHNRNNVIAHNEASIYLAVTTALAVGSAAQLLLLQLQHSQCDRCRQHLDHCCYPRHLYRRHH